MEKIKNGDELTLNRGSINIEIINELLIQYPDFQTQYTTLLSEILDNGIIDIAEKHFTKIEMAGVIISKEENGQLTETTYLPNEITEFIVDDEKIRQENDPRELLRQHQRTRKKAS